MNKIEVEFEVSELGELSHPDLHDSRIIGINLIDEDLAMRFLLPSGKIIIAIFKYVEDSSISEFRTKNIVLDVTIDSGRDVSKKALDKLFIQGVGNEDLYCSMIESTRAQIRNRQLFFVEINPSQGCQAIILCKSIQFFQEDQ